jgi:DNA-3-methyladenine glycosylase
MGLHVSKILSTSRFIKKQALAAFMATSIYTKGMALLPRSWFERDAVVVAHDLLGKNVRVGECEGIIVETEAYTTDAASHGRVLTERSRLMHETHGYWYVYFTYGMHYCVNITTNKGGVGAVLIRAVIPTKGIPLMEKRRGNTILKNLCSGPAKFSQAFGMTKKDNGLPLTAGFGIYDAPSISDIEVSAGSRIGIRNGLELPWRFTVTGSPFLSK